MPDIMDVVGIIISIVVCIVIYIALTRTGGILDDLANNLLKEPTLYLGLFLA